MGMGSMAPSEEEEEEAEEGMVEDWEGMRGGATVPAETAG